MAIILFYFYWCLLEMAGDVSYKKYFRLLCIKKLAHLFTIFGLPEVIVRNNGAQFRQCLLKRFTIFLRLLDSHNLLLIIIVHEPTNIMVRFGGMKVPFHHYLGLLKCQKTIHGYHIKMVANRNGFLSKMADVKILKSNSISGNNVILFHSLSF